MDAYRLGEALWMIHLEHMRVLDQIVEKSQIRGENGVLLYLYHIGRPIYSGELTKKLCLTTGRIANILRELEKNGLILRAPDATDKRRISVSLTPQGEAIARQKNEEVIRYHARMISQFEGDDALTLLRLLRRMAESLDENG